MDIREFVMQLALFFNMTGNEEQKKAKMERYVDLVGAAVFNKYGSNYDYNALLTKLQLECDKLPLICKVIDYLDYGRVIQKSFSGREGEIVKRMVNGIEYEFTIVPNHWDKVKTIEQLDKDILWRAS